MSGCFSNGRNISVMTANDNNLHILGPFVADITDSSVKIWLHASGAQRPARVFVTLHPETVAAESTHRGQIDLAAEPASVGIASFDSLMPDRTYFYRLWLVADTVPLDLQGLKDTDLFFTTLPKAGFDKQLDFLLMSCHNPFTAAGDGFHGCAVWRQIPQIISRNKNVRFAILAGDQVYGDEIEAEMLGETNAEKRLAAYLKIYRKFWSSIHYRRVLCSLPAVMMWDDHDITDGWGSREDSFVDKDSAEFKPEWKRLFNTAARAFALMQGSRNPPPPSGDFSHGFDTCFKIGRAGFILADLRSNRNVHRKTIWHPAQLEAIMKWVERNKADLDTLFFISSVVFSHGAPQIERSILKHWFRILDLTNRIGRLSWFKSLVRKFTESVGDLRDDINDAWGSEVNQEEADRLLDFLFAVQNDPDKSQAINVVILSGDIHTPGYSTIYSSLPAHAGRAVIPHIVATPVAYQPFSWIGEAIFRHLTRTVKLGKKNRYTAQVSHHFCYRNVVVVSLRNYEKDESHLKVKYYLENFPEPQIMLFDLNYSSRREAIDWEDNKATQPLP